MNIVSHGSPREHEVCLCLHYSWCRPPLRPAVVHTEHVLAFYCSVLSFLMDIFGLCNASHVKLVETPVSFDCKNVLKHVKLVTFASDSCVSVQRPKVTRSDDPGFPKEFLDLSWQHQRSPYLEPQPDLTETETDEQVCIRLR